MTEDVRQDECAQSAAVFESEALPHLAKLFRVAAWLMPNCAGAEMLVQQTFAQALNSLSQLEAESDACVWLVRIMYEIKNKPHPAWSSWSSSSNHRAAANASKTARLIVVTASFELPSLQEVTEEEILNALRSLPLKLQEVILLLDVEALTYKEVAEVLNVTVAVVTMRLSQARLLFCAKLRDCSNVQAHEKLYAR